MQLTVPLILIAIGSIALVTQRDWRLVLPALLVQWAGMAWHISSLPTGPTTAPVEIVTALIACAILALTACNLSRQDTTAPKSKYYALRTTRYSLADVLWLWVIALVTGVAGVALARLYTLGAGEQNMLAFYWIALPAILILVIDGAREPVKLGAGLLSFLNAVLLLIYILGSVAFGVALLGLASLARLGIATAIAYAWLLLRLNYPGVGLDALFDAREGKTHTETALALVGTSPAGQPPTSAVYVPAVVSGGNHEPKLTPTEPEPKPTASQDQAEDVSGE